MSGDEIARQSVRGSLILFVGNFVSTAISAAAIILIARLLGPPQYGVYTLAFVVPGLLQLFVGLGVNSSVTRYSAYYLSIGRPEEAKRFTLNGIYFVALLGAALTVATFLLAAPLSSLVLHRPELSQYVGLASLYVFGFTLLQIGTSAAIGWNWMGLASLSQVVQSALRLAIAPLLILAGFGVYGAISGQVSSLVLAGLMGVLLLYAAKFRGRSSEVSRFAKDAREMVGYGLPIFVGSLLSGLALYYVTIILAGIASNAVVGLYQAAVNITSPVALVSSAVAGALFPAFASLDGVGGNIQSALRLAVKYVAFLVTPVVVFLAAASDLLIGTFYGSSWLGSVPFLQLLAVSYLPVALGFAVIPVFFNGFGRTRLTMYSYLVAAAALAVAAPLLSVGLGYGVDGLIYSLFASYLTALVFGVVVARRYMKATLGLRQIMGILAASVVSGGITSVLPTVAGSSVLSLILDVAVFFGVYLTLAPAFGVIGDSDMYTLRLTLGELKVVGRLASPVLRYEGLVISLTRKVRKSS